MGAIVSKTQLEKIREYINSALEERGTVLCGEGIDVCYVPDANKNGFFMRPTVISGLQADSRCLKEEIAGPVVCVVPFSTEAEAVSLVNKTCLSQGASIWTSNLVVAHRLAHRLKVRKVWTNCWSSSELDAPSEMETDSGKAALAARDDLEFFTLPKTVTTMVLHEEEGEELDFY
nr:2-aminomuconic semialdehyde dehydrogenase-like [Cherax quadricarinatus]